MGNTAPGLRNHPHRKRIYGLVAIVLLILISAVSFIHRYPSAPSQSKTITYTPTPSPISSSQPHLLPTSTPTPTPQSATSAGTYTNSAFGFSLSVPNGWKTLDKQHPTDDWIETVALTNPTDANISGQIVIWNKHPKRLKTSVTINDLYPTSLMKKSTINGQTVYTASDQQADIFTNRLFLDRPEGIVEIGFVLKGTDIIDQDKQTIAQYIQSLKLL